MPLLPHPSRWLSCFRFALLLPLAMSADSADAQVAAVESITKTGTLVGVEQKGRLQILKYTDEAGEEQLLPLNPKIQAYVQAPGDMEFLQPGQFIATIATESNKQLFAKEVSVLLFGKGRPPAGGIKKAPRKVGQSENAYQVTGAINAIGADADYPEYQRVDLKVAGPNAPLLLEKDVKVTVKSMDFSLAAAGTPIELQGKSLKNGRFIVSSVAAKLEEPLKATDVLGEAAEGAKAAE